MTINAANYELDAIRNDRTSDTGQLIRRVDAVGAWAAKQKHSATIGKILSEASMLADRLQGGSGKGGNRIVIA
jgi:hypothetical protein